MYKINIKTFTPTVSYLYWSNYRLPYRNVETKKGSNRLNLWDQEQRKP